MAEPLTIDNTGVPIIERSQLAADALATDTALTLVSSANMQENQFVLVVGFGQETAELRGITGITGNVLTVPGLSNAHRSQTLVFILQADRYRVYRAANVDGTVPTFVLGDLLAELDIDVDDVQTTYVDSTGGSGYWYKVTQYNSLADSETALEDSTAVRGGGTGDYATMADIREDAGFEQSYNLPDATVSRYRRRAQAEIDSKLGAYFTVPFAVVPEAIHDITCILAAGWLQLKDYGAFGDGTNKDGREKLKEAREWLGIILTNAQNGLNTIPPAELLDTTSDDRVEGWPDDTTAMADRIYGAGGDVAFRIGEGF